MREGSAYIRTDLAIESAQDFSEAGSLWKVYLSGKGMWRMGKYTLPMFI